MPKKLQSNFGIEKVQGRAMLRWDGKKPLERIEYFPAQEKEIYGDKKSADFNKLFWGDNLQVLAHLLKEYRGMVDLIYIDPPFDSKADYVKKVKIRGEKIEGVRQGLIEEKQYTDMWDKDEYLQFIYERLILMRELLSEDGAVYVHADWHKGAYIKLVLDEVFGENNFVREIIWNKMNPSGGKAKAENWIHAHDNIYFYAKDKSKLKFNKQYQAYSEEYIKKRFVYEDEKDRYRLQGNNRKQYLSESKGKAMISVWDFDVSDVLDIPNINVMALERTDYPTQKPEELIEQIILASSDIGDVVMDCFLGSGTTVVAAQKLGRRWIGCDINIGAIQTTTKRLNQTISAQTKEGAGNGAWSLPENDVTEARKKAAFGFKVLNVNDYNVFKNEIEAKEIVMEMYGVEKARLSHFDGLLDNSFVKVMPINRVCSKKDVDDVLKGVRDNLSGFTAKSKSRHGESVYQEGVMVFCSGLEMDMIDYLKKKNDTGVDIDVRDILLDKQTLIFKQKPEAEITVKGANKKATIRVEDFISPILMRKLEIENEKTTKKESRAKIEDHRQVIDSVAIDIDYDGNLFNAEIIDVPSKNELIKGEYTFEYPKAGKKTLAIKIVDVLGEEYFETFEVKV